MAPPPVHKSPDLPVPDPDHHSRLHPDDVGRTRIVDNRRLRQRARTPIGAPEAAERRSSMKLTAMNLTVIHLAAGLSLYGALRLAATPRFEAWSHGLGLLTGMCLVLYATRTAGARSRRDLDRRLRRRNRVGPRRSDDPNHARLALAVMDFQAGRADPRDRKPGLQLQDRYREPTRVTPMRCNARATPGTSRDRPAPPNHPEPQDGNGTAKVQGRPRPRHPTPPRPPPAPRTRTQERHR